jgi:hypothetical protein
MAFTTQVTNHGRNHPLAQLFNYTALHHLPALRHIRAILSEDCKDDCGRGIVQSKLNYCNALFYDAPSPIISKVYRVQSYLATIIMRSASGVSVIPLLRCLHWLSVNHRIQYKMALTVCKVQGLNSSILSTLAAATECGSSDLAFVICAIFVQTVNQHRNRQTCVLRYGAANLE